MHENIRTLHKGQFLELKRDAHWEYVTRCNARGAAAILAITAERELVLVEQYRIPLQGNSIELPAGVVGDTPEHADETIEASALRELLEETGFGGENAQVVLQGPSAAGLTSETYTLVAVNNLRRQHAGGGVDGENITVHVVPLTQIDEWLAHKAAQGLHIEPKIYAGLYFVLRGKY